MKKQETCSCGTKQDIRYRWINVPAYWKNGNRKKKDILKLVQWSRNELICHCDTCGKKWGEHTTSPYSKKNIKKICVAYKDVLNKDDVLTRIPCKARIKNQTEERYKLKGNYCDKCDKACENCTTKERGQTPEEQEKFSKDLEEKNRKILAKLLS